MTTNHNYPFVPFAGTAVNSNNQTTQKRVLQWGFCSTCPFLCHAAKIGLWPSFACLKRHYEEDLSSFGKAFFVVKVLAALNDIISNILFIYGIPSSFYNILRPNELPLLYFQILFSIYAIFGVYFIISWFWLTTLAIDADINRPQRYLSAWRYLLEFAPLWITLVVLRYLSNTIGHELEWTTDYKAAATCFSYLLFFASYIRSICKDRGLSILSKMCSCLGTVCTFLILWTPFVVFLFSGTANSWIEPCNSLVIEFPTKSFKTIEESCIIRDNDGNHENDFTLYHSSSGMFVRGCPADIPFYSSTYPGLMLDDTKMVGSVGLGNRVMFTLNSVNYFNQSAEFCSDIISSTPVLLVWAIQIINDRSKRTRDYLPARSGPPRIYKYSTTWNSCCCSEGIYQYYQKQNGYRDWCGGAFCSKFREAFDMSNPIEIETNVPRDEFNFLGLDKYWFSYHGGNFSLSGTSKCRAVVCSDGDDNYDSECPYIW